MKTRKPGVAFYGKVRIPTIGHRTAIDTARNIAGSVGGKLTIGLSGTSEPLDLKTKKAHAEKVFEHPVMAGNEHTKTLVHFLTHLNKNHDELHLVAGSDRVEEYKRFIQQYNGKRPKNGLGFNFKKWEVHPAGGQRVDSNKDPRKMSRDELVSSVSASKLEGLAKAGNWEHFKAYHPGMPISHVKKIYNQIRSHHNLKESVIGLTLERDVMPQITDAKAFLNYLKTQNVSYSLSNLNSNKLSSSQMEFDHGKVESLRTTTDTKPIIVSNDNHVLDGHHRWLADKLEGRDSKAYVCDLPILDLMYHAKHFCAGALNEDISHKDFGPMLDSFTKFASEKLGIKSIPEVRYKSGEDDYNSFAAYNPSKNELSVATKNRHPMDVFRSVAHELVHHKQNEDGRIGKDIAKEGETGSDIENEANAEAGKIMRWFAKENPNMFAKKHIVEQNITEGLNDPGKLKAIFLAGGPGSGKDYVMNSVLNGEGLREINSDTAFEFLMRKNNLDLEMPEHERVERDIVRGRAKGMTKEKERLSLAGRLGLIINGTADDLDKIKKVKVELENMGYETMMVFVNTSDEVSRQRNVERGKMGNRKVPDGTDKAGNPDGSPDIRTEKWKAAQKNIGELQKIFGNEHFAVIDNSVDTRKASPDEKNRVQANFSRIRRLAQQFVRAENKNPNARKWIEAEAQKRGVTHQEPKRYKTLTQIRQGAPSQPEHKPNNEVMAQARRLGLSYYGFGRFGRKVNGKNTVLFKEIKGRLERIMNEDINKKFEDVVLEGKDTHKMEWGTDYLRKDYEKNTPGSIKMLKTKRFVPPKTNSLASPLPNTDGIGPEIKVDNMGIPMGLSESIRMWMENPKTKQKFTEKYGDLAEQKILETAIKLHEANCGTGKPTPKNLKSLMERKLTSSEKKKREEVAQAIHRDNPGMPMAKKMAIATAQAKKNK